MIIKNLVNNSKRPLQAWFAKGIPQLPYVRKFEHIEPKAKEDMFWDELYYAHGRDEPFERVLNQIKEGSSRDLNERAVAYLLYNMTKAKVDDTTIRQIIEDFVGRYRGKYTRRVAFGALAGGLRAQVKPSILRVFVEDFLDEVEWFNITDWTDMTNALSVNKSLPRDERISLFKEVVEPRLVEKFNKFKFIHPMLYILFTSLTRMRLFDTQLFTMVAERYPSTKNMGLKRLVDAYKMLEEADSQNALPENVAKTAKAIREKIKEFEKSRWNYNVHELRYYTYEELFERRDEIRYPDQTFKNWTINPEEKQIWEEIKQEDLDRLNRGQDLSEVERMTDEQLSDFLDQGGNVVYDDADLELLNEQRQKEEELHNRLQAENEKRTEMRTSKDQSQKGAQLDKSASQKKPGDGQKSQNKSANASPKQQDQAAGKPNQKK